jgi:hypothetical protein
MKHQEVVLAVILVLLSAIPSFTQTNSVVQTVQKQGAVVWTVEVVKINGLLGTDQSRITVNSAGEFVCNNAKLPQSQSLFAESLRQLSQLVAAVRLLKTKNDRPNEVDGALCKDCDSMQVVLTRRETEGKIKVYASSWDVVTQAQVSEEMLNLYNGVMALPCP